MFDKIFKSTIDLKKVFFNVKQDDSDLQTAEVFIDKLDEWIELVLNNLDKEEDKLEYSADLLNKAVGKYNKFGGNTYKNAVIYYKADYIKIIEDILSYEDSYRELKEILGNIYGFMDKIHHFVKYSNTFGNKKTYFYFPVGDVFDDEDTNKPMKNPVAFIKIKMEGIKQYRDSLRDVLNRIRAI